MRFLLFILNFFNCQIGHFPMKYLGVPVSYSTLRAIDWDFVDDKFLKCCESWIGNAASSGLVRLRVNPSGLKGFEGDLNLF